MKVAPAKAKSKVTKGTEERGEAEKGKKGREVEILGIFVVSGWWGWGWGFFKKKLWMMMMMMMMMMI